MIDAEGEQAGILSLEDALAKAQEASLDLVEVSPNAEPPVCRIMDFGKYLFEQKKKSQAGKTKTKQVQVKEIKFRPGTDIGDYNIKLQKLIDFLENRGSDQNYAALSRQRNGPSGAWRQATETG